MPAFYGLALPQSVLRRAPVLRHQPFGPPLLSDPAAWSAPFPTLIASMSTISDSSEDHVRRRMQQLIDEWGGVEAFGQPGICRLEQTLTMLGLQITYFFPHVLAGLRAMRHIAGELAAAGRVPATHEDELLRMFHQAMQWTRTSVDARPAIVARPTLPREYGNEDDWLAQVEQDLEEHAGGDTVFAEITRFRGHYPRPQSGGRGRCDRSHGDGLLAAGCCARTEGAGRHSAPAEKVWRPDFGTHRVCHAALRGLSRATGPAGSSK